MTWEVGDLALCVDDSPCRCCGEDLGLSVGRTYRVMRVGVSSLGSPCILFAMRRGRRHDQGGATRRFRKILPDKHEGDIADWQLILETNKRKEPA